MNLLDKASLILTPNAYKAGKLYSAKPANGTGDLTFTRNSTKTRINQNGVLESVAVNTPSLTYNNGIPCWLFEPQRTNLDINSATFSGFSTQQMNLGTSNASNPMNIGTIGKLIPDTSLNQHRAFIFPTFSGLSTVWCYAKADGYSFLSLGDSGGLTGANIIFNLSDGTISGSDGGMTARMDPMGNGWYKCVLIGFSASSGGKFFIVRNANNTNNFAGDGTSGILFCHKQMEVGLFDTSPIVTTGTTATRIGEQATAQNIIGLIGQPQGTIFVDVFLTRTNTTRRLVGVSDVGLTNRVVIQTAGNAIGIIGRASNAIFANITSSQLFVEGRNKIAFSYSSGYSVLCLNGVIVGTSFDTFTFNSNIRDLYVAQFEANDNTGQYTDLYNTVCLFTNRLNNQELITLTTL